MICVSAGLNSSRREQFFNRRLYLIDREAGDGVREIGDSIKKIAPLDDREAHRVQSGVEDVGAVRGRVHPAFLDCVYAGSVRDILGDGLEMDAGLCDA